MDIITQRYYICKPLVVYDLYCMALSHSMMRHHVIKESIMGIEKPVPRVYIWYHEACQVMTNADHKGHIFLLHPYICTN